MVVACQTWQAWSIGMQAHMHVSALDDQTERARSRTMERDGPTKTICRNGRSRMSTHGIHPNTQASRLESMRGIDQHFSDMVGRRPTEIRLGPNDSRRQWILVFFIKKRKKGFYVPIKFITFAH